MPELATMLRKIAERVKAWEDADVAEQQERGDLSVWRPLHFVDLERLAAAFEDGTLRFHRKRGGQRGGIALIEKRIEWARGVIAHIDQHGGSIESAAGKLAEPSDGKEEEAIRKAAQEYVPILRLPDEKRDYMIAFKRLEAFGGAKVKRRRAGK